MARLADLAPIEPQRSQNEKMSLLLFSLGAGASIGIHNGFRILRKRGLNLRSPGSGVTKALDLVRKAAEKAWQFGILRRSKVQSM